jgi:hypothetical protein
MRTPTYTGAAPWPDAPFFSPLSGRDVDADSAAEIVIGDALLTALKTRAEY